MANLFSINNLGQVVLSETGEVCTPAVLVDNVSERVVEVSTLDILMGYSDEYIISTVYNTRGVTCPIDWDVVPIEDKYLDTALVARLNSSVNPSIEVGVNLYNYLMSSIEYDEDFNMDEISDIDLEEALNEFLNYF